MTNVAANTSTPVRTKSGAASKRLLEVRDLSVSFNDGSDWFEVLNKVSFDVKPGETVGVVGESGCGKSLTALSILGLLPRRGCRRTGQILFDGGDLVTFGEGDMRKVRGRKIGMIFQEPMSALDPVFTVGHQITETVRAHFKVSSREAHERAVAALAAVGIPSPRNCGARECRPRPAQRLRAPAPPGSRP